jgi:hypothetical protein
VPDHLTGSNFYQTSVHLLSRHRITICRTYREVQARTEALEAIEPQKKVSGNSKLIKDQAEPMEGR